MKVQNMDENQKPKQTDDARSPAWTTAHPIDFYVTEPERFRELYRGRFADLFFANEDRVAHKWLHYFAIYDHLLQPFVGTAVRMLEIGVNKGGSLALWRRFFGEKAVIFGVDVNPECAALDSADAAVRIGSQDDATFLEKVVAEMGGIDVVLDDGSHVATHQRASYNILFPLLNEGGLYLIEDMCTAYWPPYQGGLGRPGTAIEFLKEKVDEMHRHYLAPGLNTPEHMTDIESVQFFDSIAAVRKRRQLPRHHLMVPPAAKQGA